MKMDSEMVRHFNLVTVYSSESPDLFGFVCLFCLFALGFQYRAESSFMRHLVFLKYSNIIQKL